LPAEGFEPPTYGLQNRCTTTVLSRPGVVHYSRRLLSGVADGRVLAYTFPDFVAGTDRTRTTIMIDLRNTVSKTLKNKKVHRSFGAIAGFASAMSVIVGTLAAYATPKGWGRVTMALHMTKKQFIVKLAPLLTGASVAIATAAGLLGFYLWLTDRQSDAPEEKPDGD
jgi:hypothetical protein